MELCLGTVQLGMNYGISGQKQPTTIESMHMLDYATQNGINTIDTAAAYGTAEDVIGLFLKEKTVQRERLTIISKMKPNVLDDISTNQYYNEIKKSIHLSLKRLNVDYLDGYLLHSARYVFNDEVLSALSRLKNDGYVKKVGVSIYLPEEAKTGILSDYVDLIQLPFSIFDQRMRDNCIFNIANEQNVEIHSRSAFLQGLILMNEQQVPTTLSAAKPIVKKIDEICSKMNISRILLAISFVKRQTQISRLVFGVDNINQLKENISLFGQSLDDTIVDQIASEFKGLSTNIIMPSLWAKEI